MNTRLATPEVARQFAVLAHEVTIQSISDQIADLGKRLASSSDLHFADQESALVGLLDSLDSVRQRLLSARDSAAELAEGAQ